MTDYCKELLHKELERIPGWNGKKWKYSELNPSKRFVNWLFNHYYCYEMLECYYDSEPHLYGETFDMYLDYVHPHPDMKHSNGQYTDDELRAAFEVVEQAYKDYEPERLTFNNWVDVSGEGIWHMSQIAVDAWAKECLLATKKYCPGYHGRLFIAENDDLISIYYFGRDVRRVDFHWTFQKRARRLR